MRFAYADPPYLGYASYYDHPDAALYDTIKAHRDLVNRLIAEYPDGWALSMTSGNLHDILPLCPKECRIMAWTKPFCSFKPGVNPAYAWEPVVVRGGRKRTRDLPTVRDWLAESITLRKGLTGAKPREFCYWIFDVLNVVPGDVVDDLFPGTGIITEALREYVAGSALLQADGLFACS